MFLKHCLTYMDPLPLPLLCFAIAILCCGCAVLFFTCLAYCTLWLSNPALLAAYEVSLELHDKADFGSSSDFYQFGYPTIISSLTSVAVQSGNNLLNRFRNSDTNLYQRNLEAQALLAQQQALGLGIQGLSSQTALDLLQVSSPPARRMYRHLSSL